MNIREIMRRLDSIREELENELPDALKENGLLEELDSSTRATLEGKIACVKLAAEELEEKVWAN